MKTKYSTVLKVKKQALNKAESNLNAARNRQAQNEEALKEATDLSSTISKAYPTGLYNETGPIPPPGCVYPPSLSGS